MTVYVRDQQGSLGVKLNWTAMYKLGYIIRKRGLYTPKFEK
jgi:hypothetical protein